LSFYQYLKIISGKTAALFEASFYAGAIFSGCSDIEARKYKQLGFNIGMIFQLSDDCIDFEDTVEMANKPVQSDFEQGVITLPLLHAFSKITELKTKASNNVLSRKEINEAVTKTGGLSFTHMVIKKYYNKSMKIVDELDILESKKARIITVLNKASRLS
jgi:heptaprenyl diphosphate synthase